jgi:hypothetical protein
MLCIGGKLTFLKLRHKGNESENDRFYGLTQIGSVLPTPLFNQRSQNRRDNHDRFIAGSRFGFGNSHFGEESIVIAGSGFFQSAVHAGSAGVETVLDTSVVCQRDAVRF